MNKLSVSLNERVPISARGLFWYFEYPCPLRCVRRFSDGHPLENCLQRHGVHATTTGLKKFAIAFPRAILINHFVRIVISFDSHLERMELEPLTLLGVALGFFDLTDHAVIHCDRLLFVIMIAKRHADSRRAFS